MYPDGLAAERHSEPIPLELAWVIRGHGVERSVPGGFFLISGSDPSWRGRRIQGKSGRAVCAGMKNNVTMLATRQGQARIHRVEMEPAVHKSKDAELWSGLLARVGRDEDRQAFGELFNHFAPQLKAYGLSTQGVSGVSAFADELVQETMVKVWKRAVAYDPERAGASTWIFAIARNARIDLLRRGARHTAHLDADDVWLEAEEDSSPDFHAEADRTRSAIRSAIQQLPSEQAQVLAKVYMEGKSHSEVAGELELPLGTVKSRVRLALNKMKLLVQQ